MKALSIPLGIVLLASTQSLAKCRFDLVTWHYGFDANQTGEANSGKECSITFNNGKHSDITSMQIVRQPKHGVASWNGSPYYAKITYKSKSGYTGPDDFVYGVTGINAHGKGTSNITVTLAVD